MLPKAHARRSAAERSDGKCGEVRRRARSRFCRNQPPTSCMDHRPVAFQRGQRRFLHAGMSNHVEVRIIGRCAQGSARRSREPAGRPPNHALPPHSRHGPSTEHREPISERKLFGELGTTGRDPAPRRLGSDARKQGHTSTGFPPRRASAFDLSERPFPHAMDLSNTQLRDVKRCPSIIMAADLSKGSHRPARF
jgi:hypothetical protein